MAKSCLDFVNRMSQGYATNFGAEANVIFCGTRPIKLNKNVFYEVIITICHRAFKTAYIINQKLEFIR